jgi:hypothetical protein
MLLRSGGHAMIIQFVTLNTGHLVSYNRDDFPDHWINEIKAMLRKDGVLWRGLSVVVKPSDRYAQFDLYLDGVRMTHCWLCKDQSVTDAVWADACAMVVKIFTSFGAAEFVKIPKQPTAPWLAVCMAYESIEKVRDDATRVLELPIAEIGVAWTLMERT